MHYLGGKPLEVSFKEEQADKLKKMRAMTERVEDNYNPWRSGGFRAKRGWGITKAHPKRKAVKAKRTQQKQSRKKNR